MWILNPKLCYYYFKTRQVHSCNFYQWKYSGEWELGRINLLKKKFLCWEQDTFSCFLFSPNSPTTSLPSYPFIPASWAAGNMQKTLLVISIHRAEDGTFSVEKNYWYILLAGLTLLFWKMAEDWIHFALVSKATSHPEIRSSTCLHLNWAGKATFILKDSNYTWIFWDYSKEN